MTVANEALAEPVAQMSIPKSAAIGAAIGFVVVGVAFTAICLAVGYDQRSAGVIALFAAVWGGPGFGALMGAVWAAHPPEQR